MPSAAGKTFNSLEQQNEQVLPPSTTSVDSESQKSLSNNNQHQQFNNTATLNSFNSVKSKKFQVHTRKLIQIALEMLMKSQVPSIQYISLTTINRIFDIYVYHNLFYPGYYESCYVPLSKRLLNKQQQQQAQLENEVNEAAAASAAAAATAAANAAANEKKDENDTGIYPPSLYHPQQSRIKDPNNSI